MTDTVDRSLPAATSSSTTSSTGRVGADTLGVTFHGVRGSTPCGGPSFARYGGNTACVELHGDPNGEPVFFDLGTGARALGQSHLSTRPFRGTCLLTHPHWDHVQGLPFFPPLLRSSDDELHIYAPTDHDGRALREVVEQSMRPPLFPLPLDALPGSVEWSTVGDDDFAIGGLNVISRLVPHTGPTLGYRVTRGSQSVAYVSDHQQPPNGGFSMPPGVSELVTGVDLLIHDAQYTRSEFAAKTEWGHSTVDYAVWVAVTAGVGRLVLFHHDPTHTDDDIDAMLAYARSLASGVEIIAAAEGLRLDTVAET